MKKEIVIILIALGVTLNCKSQILIEKQKMFHDLDSIGVSFHLPRISFGVANCDTI